MNTIAHKKEMSRERFMHGLHIRCRSEPLEIKLLKVSYERAGRDEKLFNPWSSAANNCLLYFFRNPNSPPPLPVASFAFCLPFCVVFFAALEICMASSSEVLPSKCSCQNVK